MKVRTLSRFALILPLLLAACGPAAVGSYFAPTAAVVNGQKIPETKISRELQNTLSDPKTAGTFRGAEGAQKRLQAQREILTRLVKTQIVIDEAERSNIRVTAAEVDNEIKQIEQRFNGRAGLLKEAEKQGLTFKDVQDLLRERLLIQKVIDSVTADKKPTEEQLRQIFEQQRAQFDEQIHAAHILVCSSQDPSSGACQKTGEDLALANQIATRARNGEDFAALAQQFSKDQSNKDRGGDLGFFGKGQMVPEFENAAAAMAPGQISDPVETRFGYHVIKVISKGKTFEQAREEIEASTGQAQQNEAFQQWLADRVKKAKITVNPRFGRFDSETQQVIPHKLQIQQQPPLPQGAPNGSTNP